MEDVSNSNDDTMETEDEPVYWPDKNKRLQIIETMQKFSLFSKDCSIFHESCCCDFAAEDFAEKNRQTTIRYYFQCL